MAQKQTNKCSMDLKETPSLWRRNKQNKCNMDLKQTPSLWRRHRINVAWIWNRLHHYGVETNKINAAWNWKTPIWRRNERNSCSMDLTGADRHNLCSMNLKNTDKNRGLFERNWHTKQNRIHRAYNYLKDDNTQKQTDFMWRGTDLEDAHTDTETGFM